MSNNVNLIKRAVLILAKHENERSKINQKYTVALKALKDDQAKSKECL